MARQNKTTTPAVGGRHDIALNHGRIYSQSFMALKLAPTDSTTTKFKSGRACQAGKIFLLGLLILAAAAGGFLLGYFLTGNPARKSKGDEPTTSPSYSETEYHKRFKELVDPKQLERNLRFFTNHPHVTGSQASKSLTDFFVRMWKEYEFEVEVPEYKVLLSLPRDDKPNIITVVTNVTRSVEYQIVGQLNITSGPDSNVTYQYTPYLAYTPNGTVEGELVYGNEGSKRDFAELARRNISVKGRIVIMGTLFGSVSNAEANGAVGVILYPDPKQYAPEGHRDNDTYPHTHWLPPDGVQRISLSPTAGDPLTPFLPAVDGIYRRPLKEANLLKIPVQTISYRDAQYIMSRMAGDKVPEAWRGGFDIEYRFGPGFISPNSSTNETSIVRLEVNNELITKKIHSVIATIKGSHEPDRYILIGNHRDGWSFGASDPSSGSSTLAEISRILSLLVKQGWRPRRTIKLCSWGAEEFGLLGSMEWVEDNNLVLGDRAVAYLNTDVAVGGKFVMFVQTSPMLSDLILNHAKKITDPSRSDKTLYDSMLERLPSSHQYPGEPLMTQFKFSTDNLPFCLLTGLPTADFSYFFGYKNRYYLYPLYHSQYDNFNWIKKFVDPDFLYFKSMTQFLGGMVMELTDSRILPFSIKRLGMSAHFAYNRLLNYNSTFFQYGISLEYIKYATYEFVNATKAFESAISKLSDQLSSIELRMLNDQMTELEKKFVSPHAKNDWETSQRILVSDSFLNIEFAARNSLKSGSGDEIKKQISIALHALRSATRLMEPIV